MNIFKKKEIIACSFTGHRIVPLKDREIIKKRLFEAVEKMIVENGVTLFITGGALGFDTMAALCVLEAKERHAGVKLRVAIPCENQTKGWREADARLYEEILEKADETVMTGKVYTAGCMHTRNRYMIDNSSYCIAYKTKESGGTAYTTRYARDNGVEVINLGEN